MQVGTYIDALAILYPHLMREGPVAAVIDRELCEPGRELAAGDVITVIWLGEWSKARLEHRTA